MFSLVYGTLLRPYPYREPDRTGAAEGIGAYLAFPNMLTAYGQTHAVNLTFLDARTFR